MTKVTRRRARRSRSVRSKSAPRPARMTPSPRRGATSLRSAAADETTAGAWMGPLPAWSDALSYEPSGGIVRVHGHHRERCGFLAARRFVIEVGRAAHRVVSDAMCPAKGRFPRSRYLLARALIALTGCCWRPIHMATGGGAGFVHLICQSRSPMPRPITSRGCYSIVASTVASDDALA